MQMAQELQRRKRLKEQLDKDIYSSPLLSIRKVILAGFFLATFASVLSYAIFSFTANSSPKAPPTFSREAKNLNGVSVIVPTLREAPNIEPLCKKLFAALETENIKSELIVVDDDSRDGIEDVVNGLKSKYPISIMVRKNLKEKSLSSAVMDGFNRAQYDTLIAMDADLSHPPEVVKDMLKLVRAGEADFIVGSRYVQGGGVDDWPLHRRIISIGATVLAYPIVSLQDPMSGFFLITRPLLDHAKLQGVNTLGFKIALELAVKSGVPSDRVKEVPIIFRNREIGASKLNAWTNILYVKQLLMLYLYKSRLFTSLAIGLAIALGYLVLTLAVYVAIPPSKPSSSTAGLGAKKTN